ncbi:unnamed protein product [Rotaria sordida]|uniref:Uncharacterized protein n=1 Tax=Rotaria sordida TaxID=392033 RepID=A0A815USF7_9BILA|nr:unnamed protein product [Rotaria sordida]CAF1517904.1 unnamed protein product [Rotaria sordida]
MKAREKWGLLMLNSKGYMGGSQSQHRPRFSHCQASYYGATWDRRSYVPSHVGYGHHHHTRQRLSFGSAPTHRRIRS